MDQPKEELMYFVTDDMALRFGGVLDPTDEAILRPLGPHAKVITLYELAALLQDAQEHPEAKTKSSLPDGFQKLTPEEARALARQGRQVNQEARKYMQDIMTEERAKSIRILRVKHRYSWRAIARLCADIWGGDWESNQLFGMAICEAAAAMLGEKYDKAPWNDLNNTDQ